MDPELARQRVQTFYDQLQISKAIYDGTIGESYLDVPAFKEAERQINEQIALVERIAAEFDSGLAQKIRTNSKIGWEHYVKVDACEEILGRLKLAEEEAQIFGVKGPQLSATMMHPWVWEEAAPRWDARFFRDAVQAAATRIFDVELPKKLQVQPTSNPADLFAAFAPDRKSGVVLRVTDIASNDASWASVHRGTMLIGQGCVAAIRNPRTHRLAIKEDQVALEELATLSLLARWIDDADRSEI
jgi:hypothetical protein